MTARKLLSPMLALAAAAGAGLGQTPTTVSLTNQDSQTLVLAPGSDPALIPFTVDPAPGGGDVFHIVVSRSGAEVSLVLPSGVEIAAGNAESQGFSFSTAQGVPENRLLTGPLALPGFHTIIELPPGSAPGQYQVKVKPVSLDTRVVVFACYSSSSAVRVALAAGRSAVQAGKPVAFSGMIYDGPAPLAGATAVVSLGDRNDASFKPVRINLDDSGPLDATVGDGLYLGIWTPDRPGRYLAAMRVTGMSTSGVPFSRLASTEVLVLPALASIESISDSAVDDNGDGLAERVVVTLGLKVTTAGKYQALLNLRKPGDVLVAGRQTVTLEVRSTRIDVPFTFEELSQLGDGPYSISNLSLLYLDDAEAPAADGKDDAGNTAPYPVSALLNARSGPLSLNPATLAFGDVPVGSTRDLTIAVRNSAPYPFMETPVTCSNAVFSIMSPAASFTVPAGGQQTITVRFGPSAAGAQSGVLRVAGMSAQLSGSGTAAAAIDVTPTTLAFGTVRTGQSKDLSLTVRNSGAATLTVSRLTSDKTPFTVVSPPAPFNVETGASQSVTVRFAPQSAGGQTATLTIASNAANQPTLAVPLSGAGDGGTTPPPGSPSIEVTPARLDFGSVATGQTKDLTLTVRNTGNAALSVSSVTSSSSVFPVPGPSSFSLAAGAQQTITVRFAPQSAGAQSGTLTIASNAANQATVTVALSGTGDSGAPPTGQARIDVTPAKLDFGGVAVGQTKDLTLRIDASSGQAALTVTATTSDNPRFTVVSPATPFTVGFGGVGSAIVRFAPVAEGPQNGTLTIASNAANQPSLAVPLSGTGGMPGLQTVELKVDDGTFEQSVGYSEVPGGDSYFINRLTPPSYPATLKSVRIYFSDRDGGLDAGTGFSLVTGTTPSGGDIVPSRMRGTAVRVKTLGQFNQYEVAELIIDSGDFLVGFVVNNPPGMFPMAQDTSSPSKRSSYVSKDGSTFTPIDTVRNQLGNFGIRAVVTVGTP